MLDFRPPTIDDRELITRYLSADSRIACDTTFVNTYLWREHYDIRVCFTDDTYYKAYFTGGVLSGYTLPMTTGDIRTAVDTILDDARQRGVTPLIGLLDDRSAALIRRMYGDRVTLKAERDSFDYLYEREALAALSGKKYHAKRNHISRFFREHDDASAAEICPANSGDVMRVAEGWQALNEPTGEVEIIRDALDHFDALGLFGILLYAGDEPIAMSLGSRINDEVCDVNFEKALGVDGAYAVINNEFAKHFDTFRLLNREEDMGLEGLRKSKLSYYPDILLQKSTAVFR